MSVWIKWIGVAVLVVALGAVNAQEPRVPPPPAQQESASFVEQLGALLKERLAKTLPPELVFEKQNNWGHQAQIPSIQGLTPIHVTRNHGNWQKARVVVKDVPHRLRVNVGWLCSTAENRISFNVHLAFPTHLELQQQIWQNGVQVFTEHVRSRLQLSAHLQMEAEIQPAVQGSAAPGHAVVLRLVSGTYSCDHFVAENVGGVGGDAARWLDSGAGRSFKPWQGAVLNDFQNTIATVAGTAGDAGEVRAVLSKLLRHANDVRATALQSQGVAILAGSAPAAPLTVPICFNSALEFDLSIVARGGNPHVEHFIHPALAEAAIHVAHAAAAVASHIHAEPEHRK